MSSSLLKRAAPLVALAIAAALGAAWLRAGATEAQAPRPAASSEVSPPAPPRTKVLAPPPQPIQPAGHGWLASSRPEGTLLLHLPPRDAAAADIPSSPRADGGGEGGASNSSTRAGRKNDEGSIRLAPGTTDLAERIAWWQGRVYLSLRAEATNSPSANPQAAAVPRLLREIVQLSAARGPGPGGWQYTPGRPESVAVLPGRPTDLIAFGACRLGPVALLKHGPGSKWFVPRTDPTSSIVDRPPNPGDLELVVASGTPNAPTATDPKRRTGAWRRLELPWFSSTPSENLSGLRTGSGVWLQGSGDELLIFVVDQSAPAVRLYSTKLAPTLPAEPSVAQPSWAASTLPLIETAGGADLSLPRPDFVFRIDGSVIAGVYAPADSELRLFWLRPNRPAEEGAGITSLPRNHDVVPMDGSGRLCVVWDTPPATPTQSDQSAPRENASKGDTRIGLEIREISATTGKVLFSGPLNSDSWLSMREYQALAVMLVLLMASVLVFVLRTEPRSLPALPLGVALAEPGRRFLATVLDFIPAALLAEAVMALPAGTLLLPSQMLGEHFDLWAMVIAFAIAACHATIAEWAFGRSLGKLMTGCAIASTRRPRSTKSDEAAPVPDTSDPSPTQIDLSRPALWQCFVRNLVKWAAPVLGVFILFDPSRRHPGDVAAKTLVLLIEVEPKP